MYTPLTLPHLPAPAFFIGVLGNSAMFGVETVFGDATHDLIVTAASKIGGIGASAPSVFDVGPTLDNPSGFGVHITATNDSRINDRVIDLLNASVSSALFGQFPVTGGQ